MLRFEGDGRRMLYSSRSRAVPMMAMAMPAPMAESAAFGPKQNSMGAGPKKSSAVKVRKNFPETWLWEELQTGYSIFNYFCHDLIGKKI